MSLVRAAVVLGLVGVVVVGRPTEAQVPGSGQRAAEPAQTPVLREQVKLLVDQLGADDSAKQSAAAAELIKLGAGILPLLPDPNAALPEVQKARLAAVRTALLEAQLQKELSPRRCTIQNPAIRLKEALAELAKQTGLTVEDKRTNAENDDGPLLKLDLQKAPFWQAVDAIAKEADLRINLYHNSGHVAVVDGPYVVQPVSYQGVFRVTLKRLIVGQELDTDRHYLLANVEIAWEPRLRPLFLESQPDATVAVDDQGNPLRNQDTQSGRFAVNRPAAVETQLRLEAPRRAAPKLASLKGVFGVVTPSKNLTFTFDRLEPPGGAKGKGAAEARGPSQTVEGVTAEVRVVNRESDRWSIGIVLEYPAETADFESFESWLVNNEIYLERKADQKHFPATGGYEIDQAGNRKAAVVYHFVEENDLTLGKPEEWRLVYRTPGPITKVPVEFEFKDVPLP